MLRIQLTKHGVKNDQTAAVMRSELQVQAEIAELGGGGWGGGITVSHLRTHTYFFHTVACSRHNTTHLSQPSTVLPTFPI